MSCGRSRLGMWPGAFSRHGGVRRNGLFAALLALIILTFAGVSAQAFTATGTVTVWQGDVSNVWATAGNWSNGVPTSTHDATFVASSATGGTVTNTTYADCAPNVGASPCNPVMSGSLTMKGLEIQAGFNGAITTGSATITVGADGFSQANGTWVAGSGFMPVSGPFELTGGIFNATSNDIQLTGDFTHTGGTLNPGSGAFVFLTSAANINTSNTPILTTNLTGANNDLTFTSTSSTPGVSSTTVTYVVAGANTPLSVSVAGSAITVNVATNGSSAATSTATEVRDAVNGNGSAAALVSAALATGNDGTGVVTALSATNLSTTPFNRVSFGTNTSNGASKTVVNGDTLVVNSTLTLNDGSINQTTIPAAGTIEARAAVTFNAGGSFDGGTGQILVDGTAAQTITGPNPAGGDMPKIKVNKSAGNLTLNNTFRTSSDFEIAALAGTLTMGGTSPTLLFVGTQNFTIPSGVNKNFTGSITIGETGTPANVTLPSGTLVRHSGTFRITNGPLNGPGAVELSGQLTEDAAAGGGTATITLNGTNASQTITGNSAGTGDLPNLVITKSGTGTVTWASKIRTTRDITINSIPSGGYTTTGSTLILTGSGPQVITGTNATNGSVSQVYNDVQIGDTGVAANVTLTNPLSQSGALTLRDGSFTGTLNARGGITQNGDFDGGSGTLNIDGGSGQELTATGTTATTGKMPKVTVAKTGGSALKISNTIRTENDWTWTSGTLDGTSAGTVVFAAPVAGLAVNGAQTLPNVEFRNAGAETGRTATLNNTVTVSGATTLTEGNVDGGTVAAQGGVTQEATFDGGTTTLQLSGGSATLTGNAGTTGKLPAVDVQKGANNLTINGTVRTEKNWTWTSGSLNGASAGTVVFAAPAAGLSIDGDQTLPSVELNATADGRTATLTSGTDLTVTGTTTLTEGNIATGTVHPQGAISQAATFDGGSGTLLIDGGGAQTFTGAATAAAGNLPNVTINKGGGTLTLTTGADYIRTTNIWQQTSAAGTVTPGTSNFLAAGTDFRGTPQLNNVDARNASVTNGGTLTVNGALTLTTGNLTSTGTNVVELTSTGSITRPGGGWINGNFRKPTGTGTPALVFEVGDATNFLPVDVTFTTGITGAGTVTAATADGDHGDLANSPVSATKRVSRNWAVTNTSTGGAATIKFRWVAGDVEGGADTNLFIVGKKTTGTWSQPTFANRTATSIEATGVSSFSDFVVGEIGTDPDGSGTLTPSPTNVSAGQTGRTITFTYTTGAGGTNNGELKITVPGGWSAPSTTSTAAGYVTASTGTVSSVAGGVITVTGITLAGSASMTVVYGSTAGGGPGATAPVATGAQTWTTEQRSTANGVFTALTAGSPSVTINAADGGGTITVATNPATVRAAAPATLTFTYTAPTGGLSAGRIEIAVPADWTNPQFVSSSAGYTTRTVSGGSADTPGFNSGTRILSVDNVTLAATQTLTIVYGDTSASANGAAVTPSAANAGVFSFTSQQRSTAGGTLTTIGGSPTPEVTVNNSNDDSGTMTAAPTTITGSSTGNTIDFTFTAATGGAKTGRIEIETSGTGFAAPQTANGANPGFVSLFSISGGGSATVSVSGTKIVVDPITIDGTQTAVIRYANLTAPAGNGVRTFTTQKKSTATGTLTTLAAGSPQVTVVLPPDVPTDLSPAADFWTNDATPALTGRFTDPDLADTGTLNFEICSDAACTTVEKTFSSAGGIVNGQLASASPSAPDLADGDHYWHVRATDNTARSSNYTATRRIRVDTAIPTQALTTTSASPASAVFKNGTDVWVKPAATLKITSTVTDPASGPASATFGALAGTTANATFTGSPVSTPAGGPYESNLVDIGAGFTGPATMAITATDTAGNASAATTLTFRGDASVPTGTITAPGAAAYVGGSAVTVTVGDAADTSGSGVERVRFYACAGSCTVINAPNLIGTDTDPAGGFSIVWDATGKPDGAWHIAAEIVDQVGNVGTTPTRDITMDNTKPVQTLALNPAVGNAFLNGTTLYFRGAATSGRSFSIVTTVTDGGSGPVSSTFGAFGGTATDWSSGAGLPFTDSTDDGGLAGFNYESPSLTWGENPVGAPTMAVTSKDLTDNVSLPANLVFTNDSTAPSGEIGALANTNLRATVTLSASSADAAAGVRQAEFFSCAGPACDPFGGSSLGIDNLAAGGYTVNWDTTGSADGQYRIGVKTTDNVGNTFNSTPVLVRIDNTAPTQGVSLTPGSVTQSSLGNDLAFLTGTTLYYNGAAGGSLKIRNTVADAGAGPGSSDFTEAGLAGAFSGFSGTTNVSTPAGGPFDSPTVTWTAGASSSPTITATGKDAAVNPVASPTTLTFTNDSTLPTGDITSPAANAFVKATIALTTNSADVGSGVRRVDFFRCAGAGCNPFAVAAFASDADAAGGYTTNVDTTALSGGVHRFGTRTVDFVGGVFESTVSVTVDNGAPTQALSIVNVSPAGSISTAGTTVYYRGVDGGSFKVRSVVTDANPESATFTMGGVTTGWTFTGGVSTTPGSGTYDSGTLTYGTSTSSAPTLDVTGADRAGNQTATAQLSFVNDSTAPTGGALQCNGAPCGVTPYNASSAPVNITFTTVTDAGGSGSAGVRYTIDGAMPTQTTGTVYSGSFAFPEGVHTLKYVRFDNVGNKVEGTATISVDSIAPVVASSALDGGNKVVLTFSETLFGAPTDANFTVKVGSANRTISNVVISGNTVTLTFDGAPAATTDTVKFSYSAPVVAPLEDAAGNDAASIAETTVGGTGAAPAAPPTAPPGTVNSGGTAPLLMSAPPATTSNTSATFTFRADTTSFECSLDGSAFDPCASPATYAGLGEGSHRFSVRGVSGASRTDAASYTWTIDRTGPPITKDDGPGALTVDAGPTFKFSSSEGGTFMCSLDGGTFTGCESPRSLSGLALGDHAFSVYAVDAYGNAGNTVTWAFRVIPPESGGSTTTIFEEKAVSGEAGQVSLPDGSAMLSWPANAADGLLMTLSEPSGIGVAGFAGEPIIVVDANAWRLLTREPVTEFSVPLRLELEVGTEGVALQLSEDGGKSWRLVPPLADEVLPEGQRDGFLRRGTKLIILMRHLTLFAAVRDTVAPTVPGLSGSLGTDGLTLTWQPSSDNTGQVARYVLFVDGQPAATYSGSTLQAKVGAFAPDDTRTIQLAAEDGAGNRSALSAALRSVPALAGLSLDQAKEALTSRGLVLGTVTEQDSGLPSGTVISQTPASPGVTAQGQVVDLVVARSASGAAKFVLKVVAAKTVPLKVRHTINVRIQVTRRANVVAVLRSPSKVRLFTWKRQVRAGSTILRLRLPAAVKRTGVYTLNVWAAGIGEKQRVVRKLRIRIVGQDAQSLGPQSNPPRTQVEIVLAGGNSNTFNLNGKFRVSLARTPGAVFDRAGQKRPVHVLVVDVGTEGLALVRDFHLVFPDVPILAIVPRMGLAPLARWAGADMVIARGDSVGSALLRLVG